ncbi:hypothetical protein B0T21DRAFT_413707 [Apiosordaria backusii]|uniref:Uncharacterized protein n=1 Tax=Apiosordaria backusii TaxID=314023 RepID=A0AA40B2F0_9PEZI|nr:hypothetical protein B0T21DRAFT_413707 [Apiosordaria backusii]
MTSDFMAKNATERGIRDRQILDEVWRTGNSAWKMIKHYVVDLHPLEDVLGVQENTGEMNDNLQTPNWVTSCEARLQEMGWTSVEMVGWIASNQPGWWNADKKAYTMAACARRITGEPDLALIADLIAPEIEWDVEEEHIEEENAVGDEGEAGLGWSSGRKLWRMLQQLRYVFQSFI